jgi:hypothetical protein
VKLSKGKSWKKFGDVGVNTSWQRCLSDSTACSASAKLGAKLLVLKACSVFQSLSSLAASL